MTLAATLRYMTGSPYTIYNSNIDVDQNGQLDDPVPAGSYSGIGEGDHVLKDVEYEGGRNGAYGPDYFQLDLRAGWRKRIQDRTIEAFVDIFNLTNQTNFDNPTVAASDQRTPATFLVMTNLRGGSGFPRSVQFGMRFAFEPSPNAGHAHRSRRLDTLRGARPATAGRRGPPVCRRHIEEQI